MFGHLFDTIIVAIIVEGGHMPDREVRVWALVWGRIALYSWGDHFNLTVSLSTQVYKWVPANLFNVRGNLAMAWHAIQSGVEIRPVASCSKNRDKLRPDESLDSYSDFTLLYN